MINISFSKKGYLILIFVFFIHFSSEIFADKPYFDLSDETIKIETTFKGKEVIIFGLADSSYDTVLIIKGPNKNAKLSIKERLFGIWIETKKFTYENIPSIFFIASSSPIDQILDEKIIRQKGLSFNNFDTNNLNGSTVNDTKIYENNLYEWNRNFVRKQKENNFYKYYNLDIVDKKLFQTRIFFPANTETGIYNVKILHIKDKKIVNEDKKTIIIKKTGVGNKIYDFAINKPAFYGILCIIFSVVFGLLAATAFRRL